MHTKRGKNVHTYIFNTDLGTFEITNSHHHRMYELWLENEKLGEYASAEEAAADVAAFDTGYVEWDNLESDAVRVPGGIDGWTEASADAREAYGDLEPRDIAGNPFLVGEEG